MILPWPRNERHSRFREEAGKEGRGWSIQRALLVMSVQGNSSLRSRSLIWSCFYPLLTHMSTLLQLNHVSEKPQIFSLSVTSQLLLRCFPDSRWACEQMKKRSLPGHQHLFGSQMVRHWTRLVLRVQIAVRRMQV